MKIINEMNLSFLSCSANEGFARVAAASFASQLDPTLDEIADVKTAVSEAVTNCIVHAYGEGIGKIHIKARIYEGNKVVVTVRDTGCGIPDIERAMEPMYTTAGGERAGLGFAVMDSFMDKLKVTSRVGKGTTVRMEKTMKLRVRQNG